ncbi:hypothetical protein ACTMTI_16665 [Nonomuraea sp. H19]|uniref:hypothetical protein n=1 Tax=Nonomuraea sp. H19 TaxID=3452206 RepID=UPI003F8B1746
MSIEVKDVMGRVAIAVLEDASFADIVAASGALVLGDAIERLERRGITVFVSGIRDGHHQPLEALGVIARLDQAGHVFTTTPEAIAAARDRLDHTGILPATTGTSGRTSHDT